MDNTFSKTFKDSLGREWTPDLNVGIARRMKEIAGASIDELFPKIEKDKAAQKAGLGLTALGGFLGDPFLVFDVFYAMVKPVADKLGLTKDDVAEGIGDVESVLMADAVLRAYHDFFHMDPARQGMIRKVAETLQEVMKAARERVTKELAKIDLTAAIKQSLDALPGLDAEKLNADLQKQLSNTASA